MDLLGRFVHVGRPDAGSAAAHRAAERVIFPRLHRQLQDTIYQFAHARGGAECWTR